MTTNEPLSPNDQENDSSQDKTVKESSNSVKSLEDTLNKSKDTVSLEGKKIMVVEDDEFLRDIVSRKFATTKCILSHAGRGEEAIKMLDDEVPDIVLLDVMLPGIDGFEVLKHIKTNEKTKHVPVIMLSNLGEQEDIDKSKQLGAALFLTKAMYDLDEVIAKIKLILAEPNK